MEQFYEVLKEYNRSFVAKVIDVPKWFLQYTEDVPPLYWKTVYEILKNEDKNQSIVEIGAGFGDITALLYFMGFNNVISFERDKSLIQYINDKVKTLFNRSGNVINCSYPQELNYSPDVLVQVNCSYFNQSNNKEEYIEQVKSTYRKNGIPRMFVFETIDDSYREINVNFPHFMRLNLTDIINTFPKCQIESFVTYKFPQNKVSKTIYKICK